MSLALGDISAKILLSKIYEIFLPMFSSRNSMVSQLISKSFIHLEFTFLYEVSDQVSFFACSCPALPTPFVEEAIFTPLYAAAPFVLLFFFFAESPEALFGEEKNPTKNT